MPNRVRWRVRSIVPLLLAALLLSASPLCAQPGGSGPDTVVRFDTASLLPRTLANPDSVIAAYRGQSDFNYERELEKSSSLWEDFINWFGSLFDMPKGVDDALGGVLKVLPYIIIAIAAVFIAIRLIGADIGGVFGFRRRGAAVGKAEEVEEELQKIDLEGRIVEAERSEDWQRAVRWRYLVALREMERRRLVEYRPDRTNQEYLRGLPPSELRDAFAAVTLLFEYAWYGRVPLDAREYARVRDAFAAYGTRLQSLPVVAAGAAWERAALELRSAEVGG